MKNEWKIKKYLKRSLFGMGILITVLVFSQDPAHAKVIRGEVVSVSGDSSSLTVKRSNPTKPSITEQFDIVMMPSTKFEKISSLKELAPGDEVVVDATKKKESGSWEAHSVRIFKVQLYPDSPVLKARSK